MSHELDAVGLASVSVVVSSRRADGSLRYTALLEGQRSLPASQLSVSGRWMLVADSAARADDAAAALGSQLRARFAGLAGVATAVAVPAPARRCGRGWQAQLSVRLRCEASALGAVRDAAVEAGAEMSPSAWSLPLSVCARATKGWLAGIAAEVFSVQLGRAVDAHDVAVSRMAHRSSEVWSQDQDLGGDEAVPVPLVPVPFSGRVELRVPSRDLDALRCPLFLWRSWRALERSLLPL